MHTPLFIHNPRSPGQRRCAALTQTIDLAPTVLDFFGLPAPKDMLGHSLLSVMDNGAPVRQSAIMGAHGAQIICTDGRYKYVLAPRHPNKPLYNYTLMPTHMRGRFPAEELQSAVLAPPFSFTKGCPVLKTGDYDFYRSQASDGSHSLQTLLFDRANDPDENSPIVDDTVERYMRSEILRHLRENDAPEEQYRRMGLQ